MDYLMLMFPPAAVCHIVALTNTQLACMNGQDDLNVGEFWKFHGLMLLIAWLEFASCHDFWSTESMSKFLPNICLGWFGVTHNCFDAVWLALRLLH